MQYRTLGRSGLKVSPLCLGGMTLGDDWGWGADEATSEQLIRTFMDSGNNFIDTSNVYTNGHSEAIIGRVIGQHSALRTKAVIGTKFAANTLPGDPNGGGGGSKAIIENCNQSLRRLQTDYIDLYWIHQWDWNTPFEESMRTLDQLVKSGKVRYIGVSYAPAWKITQAQLIAQMKDWTPFIGLQVEYSLLERSIEDELVPMAQELGIGITPWSPLKGGILSGKYGQGQSEGSRLQNSVQLTEKQITIIGELQKIAAVHHTTPAAIALAWVMQQPAVASTIIGVRRPDQLEANLAALQVTLSADEVAALNALSTPPATFVTQYRDYARSFVHGGIHINNSQPAPLPAFQQFVPGKY